MRTEEQWFSKSLPKLLVELTPRLREDLTTIPWPKEMPDKINSLFLFGEKGVGKTVYSAFLFLQYYKQVYLSGNKAEAIFVSTPEIFLELRNSYNAAPEISLEYAIIERYRKTGLLVLDDFGTTKPTDWVYQMLYLIINYRYEYLLPTIFTSNLSLEEVANTFGDGRITSRIARMCELSKKKHWKK